VDVFVVEHVGGVGCGDGGRLPGDERCCGDCVDHGNGDEGNRSANVSAQLTVVAPPVPPLIVSISPSNQTIGIGESAIFAVAVTGGSGSISHSCTSSAPGVASVAKTDAGCEATGVAAGNATILIAVTKGSETVNVAGQVTVTATPEPAPLAITMTPASQSILVVRPRCLRWASRVVRRERRLRTPAHRRRQLQPAWRCFGGAVR
jgi:hypothetical protein